jgi:hypothetical protein
MLRMKILCLLRKCLGVISSLAEYPAQMHIYNSARTCHYDDGCLVIKCLSLRKDIWTEGAQPTLRNNGTTRC